MLKIAIGRVSPCKEEKTLLYCYLNIQSTC
nr:MAG TPA: hypothetical protein [Caudoviricetes sp.]